ncbi:MAG: helix-turn-helix domain-containing protein, partial [Verrucomicrobiota bacterium]
QVEGTSQLRRRKGAEIEISTSQLFLGQHLRASWEDISSSSVVVLSWEVSRLRELLGDAKPAVVAELRHCLFGEDALHPTGSIPLAPQALGRISECLSPPVKGHATTFWYRSRVQELLAYHAFVSGKPEKDFFCVRQNRLAAERVAKVEQYLVEHLDEPLCLDHLAQAVGCSSAYLCRTFSNHAGTTIRRRLRQLRMFRACQLLASRRWSVSEVAIEVGYHSLSHFSKAFQEEKGCLPSRYGAAA